jgi:hypothetical protein
MQRSVSIRNTQPRTRDLGFGIGNSEANHVDGFTRVLSLWPSERADRSIGGRKKLIAVIECALRQERRRGQGGHPAYDLERHAGLCRMLKEERLALSALLKRIGCQLRPSAND